MWVNNSQCTVSALERNGRQCVIDDVPVPNDNKYGAVYPASLLTNNNENLSNGVGGKSVTLPRVQHYESDALRNQIIQNPMAAELSNASASNSTLHFRNLCALLKIMVQTDDPFDSIRVTIDGKALHGAGVINTSQTNWKVDMTSPNEEQSVVLSMDDHHVSAAGETFYIVIPEVNLQASTRVTVQLLNGSSLVKTWRYTTAAVVTLTANHIHTLGSFIFNSRVFSVSATKKVYFSPGNLQWSYSAMATSHGTATQNANDYAGGSWRFAEHQYDFIGVGNNNEYVVSYTSDSWYDLFAWGGSGKGGQHLFPDGQYSYQSANLGDNDWGAFNTIYNPQTKVNDPYGTWFTLNQDEWRYVLYGRRAEIDQTGWWCYSNVTLTFDPETNLPVSHENGFPGLIIYPDKTTVSPLIRTSSRPMLHDDNNSNDINKAEYDSLEAIGCAFLPNAGYIRAYYNLYSGTTYSLNDGKILGYYWTSRTSDNTKICRLKINTGGGVVIEEVGTPSDYSNLGFSVRLAREVQ